MREDRLILHTPGMGFRDSFLVGNGHFGAACGFGVDRDEIRLGHVSFWSGTAPLQAREGAPAAFQAARRAAVRGDYASCHEALSGFIGTKGDYGTNLPVGCLVVSQSVGNVESYERSLNMTDGIAAAALVGDGIQMRSLYAMEDPKVLVLHLSDTREMDVRFSIQGASITKTAYAFDRIYFEAQAHEPIHAPGQTGVNLMGIAYVMSDGKIEAQKDALQVHGHEMMLFLGMETDYAMDPGELPGQRWREILKKCLDTEIEKAVHGYLGGKAREAVQSPFRIRIHGQEEVNRQVLFGQYLLRSAYSDKSPLPAGLQGVWNDGEACRLGWTNDLHLDVNTQMNTLALETLRMPGMQPTFDFMRYRLIPQAKKAAKGYYGLDGASCELSTNAFGYAAPYWGRPLAPCPGCGWWFMEAVLRHAEYHPEDMVFVTQTALPCLEPFVDFILGYVTEVDGRLMGGPSVSPENGFVFGESTCYADMGTAFENAHMRGILRGYLELCRKAGTEGAKTAQVAGVLERIPGPEIDKHGRIREYRHDLPLKEKGHRHLSHLGWLYPYDEITAETTELAQAAERTIEDRLENGFESTPWASVMLALYEARLGHGDKALAHLQAMAQHRTPTLLFMHPAMESTENDAEVWELDGNTGYVQAVAEMLVQWRSGKVLLLPALPGAWTDGEMHQIQAGPVTVEKMIWHEGKVSFACLHVPAGTQAEAVAGDRTYPFAGDGRLQIGEEAE